MKTGIIAILLSALFPVVVVVGQATTSAATNTQPAPYNVTADIYEAVVRFQIKSWELAADSYCVKIRGRGAEKSFLRRFAPLPVKPASGCRERGLWYERRVVDKRTRKNSVIFDLGEIRWPKRTEAEVDGGYHCGSQCMGGGTYHLTWNGTRWVVTRFDLSVIS